MKFYEPGMRIIFDDKRNAVTVTFRGRRYALDGRYENESEARIAGESYCRSLGWRETLTTPTVAKSAVTHRRSTARPFF